MDLGESGPSRLELQALDGAPGARDMGCMPRPPVLTLSDIALTFGGTPLFEDISLAVHPRSIAPHKRQALSRMHSE